MEHIPTPFIDAAPYRIQAGDQIIYDTRSGTLFLYAADGSNVALRQNGQLTERCFVGPEWSRDSTREFAELIVRTSGGHGSVQQVEGSFPTLWAFKVNGM